MPQYYYFRVSCGNGMHSTFVMNCEGMSEEDKNTEAWEHAIANAESFGDYWDDDDTINQMKESDEWGDRDFCGEDLDYFWELYSPDKHDMYRAGGGSFKEDFTD